MRRNKEYEGKEYVLSEDKKPDIPYGVDTYV